MKALFRNNHPWTLGLGLCGALFLSACVGPPSRMGMVKNSDTGIMIGSRVEKSIVTDSSLHKNNRIKVRMRNTSGDTAFDLYSFRTKLEHAYESAGYIPTSGNDFGILVDVNVRYSGQIQTNLATEYAFLGGAAGGIVGYRSNANAGTAIGAVSGATLGNIIGSYITDDTYIIITDVTYASIKETKSGEGKSITFSRSPEPYKDDEEKRPDRSLRNTINTGVAVFAGGRNVGQAEISGQVRDRIIRIVRDII
jgi:hypothetical protein